MSKWFGALAGNVESLLDKVDQVAGQALQKDASTDPNDKERVKTQPSQWESPGAISSSTYSPFLSGAGGKVTPAPESPQSRSEERRSSPATLVKNVDRLSKTMVSNHSMPSPAKVVISDGNGSGKDPLDQELFEFLNNSAQPSDAMSLGRPSSTGSSHSRRTPESQSADSVQADDAVVRTDSGHNGMSSGYHSSTEDASSSNGSLQQHVSTLEHENQLLKSEIASLNEEMQSVIHRVQATQEELNRAVHKLEAQSRQLATSEQIARELRSHESDLQEMLSTKETQLGVLRMRLEEADRLLELEKQHVLDVKADRERILQDQSSSTGFQTQALETLQDKLNDAESVLRRESEVFRTSLDEATERLNKQEVEKQNLTAQLGVLHRTLEKEKAHSNEVSSQLKAARTQAETAKQELIDYKEKAARILQSKDKLITSLKEGSGTIPGNNSELTVVISELESVRQERDILHDELRSSQHTLENLRTELADVENQMQQESETAREQISSLEDQLQAERRRRDDAEMEVSKQKQVFNQL